MAEISTASSEQSTGILQINQAIGQMELVTQQNANLVHELGNTVNTLTTETQELNETIGVFNTGHNKQETDVRKLRAKIRQQQKTLEHS